jgi:hypothetical protein
VFSSSSFSSLLSSSTFDDVFSSFLCLFVCLFVCSFLLLVVLVTVHLFSLTGESIVASRVPFLSILNYMSMDEITESMFVFLLFLELSLRLLFLSIVVHSWLLVCCKSSCLLHILSLYSFFLFFIEFSSFFSKFLAVSVEHKDSLSYWSSPLP